MTKYTCYSESDEIKRIYHEGTKVYHIYKGTQRVWRDRKFDKEQVVFESSSATTTSIDLDNGIYDIICVGGGGAAAMRGVYDDRGYGWGGGSGSAFVGRVSLPAGTYTITVGSANNNTKVQSSDTQTSNPTDTTTHDSSISGVVICRGGGSGHYNPSYVGAAGASPIIDSSIIVSTTLNSAGKAGSYNSGGKGSAAAAVCNGGASVYNSYGRGQGCRTSEYARKRSWINGTNGYVKIVYVEDNE